MHKKIIIGVLLFATIFLFANCVPENNNSESLSELTNEFNIYYDKSIIQHYTSSNKISRLFLDSFYKSGLDLKMDDERYEYFIKTALSPGGVSAYDLGYLYKYENLKGYEYAHGVIGFGIIRSLSEINGNIVNSYKISGNSSFGIDYPEGLENNITLEQAIENLELTETYQLKKEEYSVVFYEENNEKLYISYYTWHGEVVDNTLENAYGSLIFIKNIGGNTIECSYGINNGKIINKTYEVKIINNTTEIITHDKITAYFFDEQISSNNIEGYFNKISFTTDSVELTVTLKSKTGKDEAYSYTLPAAYSADNLCDLGPFEFIASGTEKTMTAVYKNNSSSWHNDYFNMSLFFDRLIKGTLSQGGLHSRLNPSR